MMTVENCKVAPVRAVKTFWFNVMVVLFTTVETSVGGDAVRVPVPVLVTRTNIPGRMPVVVPVANTTVI